VCGVDFGKVLPFLGQVIGSIDGGHWACRYAGAAIDTFHWVDVELRLRPKCRFIFPRVNAIHGTGVYASGIFGSNAGLSNDKCHNR
jgi:hypothetical protein